MSQWRGHLGLGSPHSLFLVSFLIKMEQLFLPLCSVPGTSLNRLVSRVCGPFFLLVRDPPLGISGAGGSWRREEGRESVGRGENMPSCADPLGGTGARPGRGLWSVPWRTQECGWGMPLWSVRRGGGRRLQGAGSTQAVLRNSLAMGTQCRGP